METAEEAQITEIKPADYQVADLQKILEEQTQLLPLERAKLYSTLSEFEPLFQGTQGHYNSDPIELELLPNAKPFFSKAYSIPKAYVDVTKGEIERLVNIGLLSRVQSAKWAAPTFVIPKKNGTVHLNTDFRVLNSCLARKPFPMPKIPEIFRGMENFQYTTTLDLNMGYYLMPLSEQSKQLCTTVLPWGLYRYDALPMGIKPAADIFQERMSHLFSDLQQVVAYMDDLKALGFKDFDDHLALIKEVLRQLMGAGFQVNPSKCCWFASKVNYLGFKISRNGITPQKDKIQGILNMAQPRNQKDVRRFVGLVNFYCDLYPRRAEILAPLTSLCGKNTKFVWNKEHNEAFLKLKQVMAAETMPTYPNFDKPFVVHTDASNKQIGGVTQNNKPLGFFSKKLADVQRRFSVTEQGLLAITETLKYFHHMLLRHRILIKTDHKNLVHPNSHHASDRVLRQRLLIEEYRAELEYIKGETNTIADTLSRVPTKEILLLDQPTDEDFPLDLTKLAKLQEIDDNLQAAVAKQQRKYKEIMRGTQKLWAHLETEAIYVPVRLRATLLHWYHDCLQHLGVRRMQATIKQNLYWPGRLAQVKNMLSYLRVQP